MDANQQRPFLLARDDDWARLGAPPAVAYDRGKRLLRLASSRRDPGWLEDEATAIQRLLLAPGSVDRFGTWARRGPGGVVAGGAFPGEVPIFAGPEALIGDVAIGHDDVLYLAVDGAVVLKDLRDRWAPASVPFAGRSGEPAFVTARLAPRPGGGAYGLDPTSKRLAVIAGLPMRPRAGIHDPGVFRPRDEDADPPRGRVLRDIAWPAGEQPVAIACSPDGRLAVLSWLSGQPARLRLVGDDERLGAPISLGGVRFPYSLAWLGGDRVAVLIARTSAGTPEAAVYPVDIDSPSVDPVGDLYPLRGHTGEPFLHGVDLPPRYPTSDGHRPLHRISWPSYATRGHASNARPIDSEQAQTVWHRLYLEADLPPGCGVRVWLATSDEPVAPGDDAVWHEHRFGSVGEPASVDVPRGAWLPQASEVPFHDGMLPCPRRKDRTGLFTALVQRAGHRVRTLVGRYLWVRVELIGDGRTTPEIGALRVYGDRKSYVQSYLPELFREQVFGPEADERSTALERVASTRADFLERFIGNFEGVLTPLEDRIKDAWLLTEPSTTPDGALEWLASWIGFGLVPGLPADRQRRMLAAAMTLYRWRGTLRGLRLALDLATGGAVTRGEVVVFEDFRLRRTFATILGADLAATDDPLLPGLAASGNSFVGDTLFLGDEHSQELLALFDADLVDARREPDAAAAIAALFDRLAHRATVLVHRELGEQDLGLIRQIVDRETPSHVSVQVVTASERFLVGMSSLVGVDTFLGAKPAPDPVRVGVSTVGLRDLIQHLPSLDPRLGHSPSTTLGSMPASNEEM